MEKQERVRLLLVDGEDAGPASGRGGRISFGAAKLVGRWPGYISSAFWFSIFVISTLLLLILVLFLLLVKQEISSTPPGNRHNIPFKQEESFKLDNDFCREMTSETNLGKREIAKLEVFNTGNNVFYIRTLPLNEKSACAAESILKNYIDKNVFILMFDNYKLDYEEKLKEKYQNLLLTKVNGGNYLKGTPFKWDKTDLNKSMIAAGLITVWQFGGTVLSDNLISYRKRNNYIENTGGACTVDYEMLSCLEQCASYVYHFINAAVNYTEGEGAAPVIDKSLQNFCGKGVKDCEGARRARNICDSPIPGFKCDFIRLDSWLEKNMKWENMTDHCPVTYRHSQKDNNTSTSVEDEEDLTGNSSTVALNQEATNILQVNNSTSHYETTTNKL